MASPKAFGNNGSPDFDGGLANSLLENASLINPLEDNSALLGLSRELNNTAGTDPLSSGLNRLAPKDTKAGNNSSLSNQDLLTNSSSSIDYTNNDSLLFNQPLRIANIPSQPFSSSSTKDKDPLTGTTKNTPFVSFSSRDSLLGTPSAKNATPRFAIKSEGTVTVNGSSDFDGEPLDLSDDALIYGGKGFTINGNTTLPVQRDAAGNPIKDASFRSVLVNQAVAVSPGYSVSNGNPNKYANLLPPSVIEQQKVFVPAYADVKQRELLSRTPAGIATVIFSAEANSIKNRSLWASKFPAPGTATRPTVVRVTGGGLTIPSNVSLSNYIITVDSGDINFNGSGHNLNNVVLVAEAGNVNLANIQATDVSVFASGSINANGGARFAGRSLIANASSQGNITFDGATLTRNASDRLTVISQGSISYNGASATRGTFLSGKDFSFNGKSTLYGSIAAKGNIIFNGNATVIADFADPTPPAISATLVRDTAPEGRTNSDLITFDSAIWGTVTDASIVTAFRAGFNSTPKSSFVNVLSQLNADGSFSFSPAQLAQIAGGTLSDGVHTLHLQAQDLYGNVSNVFDFTFTLDTTEAAPKLVQLDAASDSGSSNSDRLTNDSTPKITGIANAGATVQLLSDGQLVGQTTATTSGTWQVATSNLADGTHSLTAIATDVAGNLSSTSAPLDVVIDTTTPVAPSGLKLTASTDTGISNSDNITNNTTPTIQGNAEALSLIRLFQNGQLVGQTTASENGTWQLAVGPLGDGLYTFTAKAFDKAGNVSNASDPLTVTVDTAVATPTGLDLLTESDRGSSNRDNITNITTPTIVGNAEAGSVVRLFSADQLIGQTKANAMNTWLLATSNLADGIHNLTAIATDVAGNVTTPSAPLQLTIDTSSPQLTLTTPVDTAPLTPAARLVGTTDGTGSAVAALTYRFDNLVEVPVSIAPTGAFNQELDYTGVNNGPHTLSITTTDSAGNIKTDSFNVVVHLDTTGPVITAALVKDTAPGGSTNTDNITYDPTITGTVTDNSRVVELRAGFNNTPVESFVDVRPSLAADSSFTFSRSQLKAIYGGTLPDGSNTLHLIAKDEYGNVSDVFDRAFTLDTTAPDAVFTLAPEFDSNPVGDRETTFETVTLVGSSEANAVVVLQQTGSVTTTDSTGSFTFADVGLELGLNTFNVKVTDVAGNESVSTKTIFRLGRLNQAPTFTKEPDVEALIGRSYVYDTLATDSDGDTLTYSLLSGPQGLVVDSATGQITWTPTASDIGTHTVAVRVADGRGGAAQQQYVLSAITPPPNRPPLFTSTPVVDANVNTPYTYQATATDVDGDVPTFRLVSGPQGMTVAAETGKVVWSPTAAQLGRQKVTLQVEDGQGGKATQTFELLIQPEPGNTGPKIISQPVTQFGLLPSGSGSSTTVNAVIRDFSDAHQNFEWSGPWGLYRGIVNQQLGPDKKPTLSNGFGYITPSQFSQWYNDVPGVNMTTTIPLVLAETSPGSGVFQFSSSNYFPIDGRLLGNERRNHNFHFTTEVHASFTYKGGEVFSFTGDDDVWVFINNKLAVDLGGVHSPASEVVNLNTLGLRVGQTYPIDIFHAERQTDGSNFRIQTTLNIESHRQYVYRLKALDANDDSLTYSLVTGPSGMKLDPVKGLLTWNPSLSQTGTHRVEVQATDGRGGVATQSFDIEVTVSNPSEIRGTAFNDIDGDGIKEGFNLNPPLEPGLQSWVVYIDENRNGQRDLSETFSTTDRQGNYFFSNLPSGIYALAIEPQAGWKQTVNTQAVILGSGQILTGVDFGNIALNSSVENRYPTITSAPPTTALPDQLLRYDVVAVDPDRGDLIYDLPLKPAGMTVDPSTGVIVWRPTTDQIGSQNVILRVQDERGGVALQSFQVSVAPANNQPVFASQPLSQAVVGLPYQYQVRAQDADYDPLTFQLGSAPSGMVINPNTGVLTWTATAAQIGSNLFTITANDGRGGQTSQSFNLPVVTTAPKDPPVITSAPRSSIALGQPYLYAVKATDLNNDPLTYSLDTAPTGMTIDSSGKLFWQPSPAQLGSNPVTIKVSDGRGGVTTQAFSVDVVSTTSFVNNSPSITSTPLLATTVNKPYQYNLTATDPDNDPLVWGLDLAPTGMSIDPATGRLRWTPSTNQVGTHDVEVRVLDAQGAFVGQAFTLTVRGANIAPKVTSTPLTTAAVGKTYTYTVLANDIEADPLTFTLASAPTGMTIDADTGLIQWTPSATGVGAQNVEILVSDGFGGTATQRYTIAVSETAANTAPAITSTPKYVASVGDIYKYAVTAVDPDGETPTFALLQAPVGMTIDPTTGLLQWTPTANQVGTHYVTVGATDASGESGGAQRFALAVAVNTPPTITSTPVQSVTAGTSYRYDLRASDSERNPLSYNLATGPIGMTVDAMGRIIWNPGTSDIGTHPIVLTVKDNYGAAVQQSYTLNVAADTQAPKVSVLATLPQVDVGKSVTLIATATDNVKVSGLTLLVNGNPVALDANGRATVTSRQVGEVNAIATATDAAGNSSQASTKIQVIDPTDIEAPVINLDLSAIASGVITAPTNLIGTVTDSNLAYYTLEVAPIGSDQFTQVFRGTQSVANGVLGKFDPSLLSNDTYTLRLSAFDALGHGSTVEDTLSVAGDLKLGNFRLSFTDLSIPVTGIPITLTRTYDTLTANTRDDFGYGWRMEFRDTDLRTSVAAPDSLQQELLVQNAFKDGTRVYITLPGGKREGFTFKPTSDRLNSFFAYPEAALYHPAFAADKGVTSTLTVKDSYIIHGAGTNVYYGMAGNAYNPADSYFGGVYTLTTKEGVVYEIDGKTGDLLTVTDTNGNKLTYTDSAITSSTGQKVTFGRDAAGRITTVTDPMGYQIRYEYDASGDLVSVTDRSNNTTRFEYNSTRSHYLDKIVDLLGRTGAKTEYDENGRLKKIVDASGNPVEMVYDPANSVQTVKDALGNPTTYEYDSRGNVVTEIDALGGITKRTYDDDNNLLSETTPEGRTTRFTYDTRGNKLSATDPLGNTTSYTYNALGQKLVTIDSLGSIFTHSYDKRGNLLSFKSATGSVILSNFDSSGKQTSLIGADGSVTQFNYDRSGNVITQIDADGNEIKYTYNANGKLLSETKQVAVNGEGKSLVTRWTYDLNGMVTSITDPAGNTTKYEYDKSGNLSAVIDSMNRRIRSVYNTEGQLVETINPDGTSRKQDYDVLGRKISDTDELGRTTHFVYDANGRLLETILPDNTPDSLADNPKHRTEYDKDGLIRAEIDPRGNRTEYVYDLAGRVTLYRDALGNEKTYTYNSRSVRLSETDALGRTTRFVYDEAGRQIATVFADGTRISNTYNAVGLRNTSTDQAGRTTYYKFDSLRRPIETIVPDNTPDNVANNPKIKWEYDQIGRLTAQIDPSGLRTEYSYDDAGRLVTISDGRGKQTFTYNAVGNRISETDPLGRTTQFVYDVMNRLVETHFPDGSRIQTTYDAFGNAVLKTDEMGRQTQFTYDAQNRLNSVVDALNQQTEYGYDFTGNLIRVKDANNNITNYEFDALNRRTAVILPLGQRFETTYDQVGNLLTQKDFNGNTIRYEYDLLNRLVNKRFQDNSSVLYSYTPTGKIRTTQDISGLTTYNYDAQDRLLSRTAPDSRIISYTYDVVGSRTSVTTPSGTTRYVYDQFHRLSQAIAPDGGNTQYTYDAVNNLTHIELPNGTFEVREYDLRNRLTFLEQNNSGGVIASYRYTLDPVGNRTQIVEQNGRQSSYSYDLLYRLTQEIITDPVLGNLTNSFTYDSVGNRLTYNNSTQGLTTYDYDANDRLVSETHNGVVTSYSYDNNGNTLSRSNTTEQVSYQWDSENHLISAITTKGNGTQQVQYRYSPEGIKVATTVDSVETRYLVDTNLPFSQILEEYGTGGALQASYVFGHDLISQERGDTRSYYHADGLGSTRLLTNTSGQVIDTYTYDAYGNLLGATGNTVNNYRYTGEQFDQNLGEYYLRARSYNPSNGRFTARDPFAGFLDEPLSLAKYPYVHGNPVNLTDPSGLFPENPLTVIILQGILAALPSVSFTTAITLARVATPIIVGSALVATYALADAYLATDADEDDFNGLPIVFFTDRDLPMHRRHVSFAQTGFGYTKSFYDAYHNGQPLPSSASPLPSVLTYQGFRREARLDQAIDIRRQGDDALIARALGIRPQYINGRTYYNIPPRSYARDEYPFASTEEGGPINWDNDLVSVEVVTKAESDVQGELLRKFYPDPRVGLVPRDPLLGKFGVLASPVNNYNSGYIRRDGSKYLLS